MSAVSLRQGRTGSYLGVVVGCVMIAMFVFAGRAAATPAAAPIPFTVGPGAVGSIGGRMGSIVSIPTGASVTPSPQGALLPGGTVVEINGTRETLTQPVPFVLTTGGIRPTTMPNTGASEGQWSVEVALLGAMLVLGGMGLISRTRWSRR
ncbi:MAG: hypothetical protein H0X37_21805 [Herpetosiphonaceae bacterium]|nr:hypothetical protein [Herpetosiphonaceae bacterium]